MRINLGVAARNRGFAKAMRRVRPQLEPLLKAFSEFQLLDPIHDAILVGVTDEMQPGAFKRIETDDEYFQVTAGCAPDLSDSALLQCVYDILLRAVRECPFSKPDHAALEELFSRHAPIRGS